MGGIFQTLTQLRWVAMLLRQTPMKNPASASSRSEQPLTMVMCIKGILGVTSNH